MGCDIHIVIQRQDESGMWLNVPWQAAPWDERQKLTPGIPVAPDVFDSRNYDKFAILANVRNGRGFAGVKTGDGWPSIAPARGLPEGIAEPDDYSLGDHSFTWITIDELRAFPWDAIETRLYGCVPADEYERLSLSGGRPHSYSDDISGPDIIVYEPMDYVIAKSAGRLSKRPYVRMNWPMTARAASGDWPGQVIPWLDMLADGRPLRLVLGFDS